MAYVTHRQGLYRTGFRPIGQTNTFAAAQGTGISPDETAQMGLLRTPFDPEVLHERLGQWHPFTPGGGYGLHGLGDIVPNGSVVTYTGKWAPTNTHGAQDIMTAVTNALNRDGLSVRNISSDAGWSQNSEIPFVLNQQPFNVTLQIQVSNGMGFGQPGDIASIVDHEVYAASGSLPLSSSVPTVQLPGGPAQPTGQPGGALDLSLTDWSAWIQQNAVWLGLGALALIVVPNLVRRLL